MSTLNKKNRGFSLLEVLISLFIMVVGLLGIAQLQLISLQTGFGAYQRSQAAILATNLAERMRANSAGVANGSYRAEGWDDWDSTPCSGVDVDCSSAGDIADNDLFHWKKQVLAAFGGVDNGVVEGFVEQVNGIDVVRLTWVEQVRRDRASSDTAADANNNGSELHEYTLPVIP